MRNIQLLFLILLIVAKPVSGAEEAFKSTDREDRATPEKSLVPLPVVFYMPETRLAGGGLVNVFFRLPGSDGRTPSSSLILALIYTQNRQIMSAMSFELYWPEDVYRMKSNIVYEYFPDRFYGIGNNTAAEQEEAYTARNFQFDGQILRKLKSNVYWGLMTDFGYSKLIETGTDGLLAGQNIPGSEGGKVSGAGMLLSVDSRDRIFTPTEGNYYSFSVIWFDSVLGSDYGFTRYAFDLRNFYSLFASHVIAVRCTGVVNRGAVPFQKMAELGGQFLMRGIYNGRYRDKSRLNFQLEYRLPLWQRFGVTGFTELGDVAENITEYRIEKLKYSYGLGLRYLLNPDEGLNLRLDAGFSENSAGIYLSIGEAF